MVVHGDEWWFNFWLIMAAEPFDMVGSSSFIVIQPLLVTIIADVTKNQRMAVNDDYCSAKCLMAAMVTITMVHHG